MVLIELRRCPSCGKPTYQPIASAFPLFVLSNLQAQATRAGWKPISTLKDGDDFLCQECASAPDRTFLCAFCEQRRPATLLKKTIAGDPPEYACRVCYETLTAAEWHERIDDAYDRHRWDFE